MILTTQMRYQGCLLGLAAGDAVGTSVEFRSPGSFDPVTDMVGGGPFRLKKGQWTDDTSMALCPEIDAVACGSFKHKNPPDIIGSGYVVESLEAALWAFYHTTDFKEGCLLAVNLGNDADTTAAVYGQIAGAFYGLASIPVTWQNSLAHKDLISGFATDLCNKQE